MFRHGEQFHVGEPHMADILDQAGGQFPVSQPAVVFFGNPPPGPQMDLVHRHRSPERLDIFAMSNPFVVPPLMGREVPHF